MKKLTLSESGFISNFLVSGPRISEFKNDAYDSNQLRYEKYLRSIIKEECTVMPEGEIRLGGFSEVGMEWKYYNSSGNWFVDVSDFYSTLKKIDLLAAVYLCVEEDMQVSAYLWTYAGVDVWLNSNHICCVERPVYKPITQKRMTLNLKKGKNLLYIKMQNLGVRDTRNIFGIQVIENLDRITLSLPDSENTKPFVELASWLSDIKLQGHTLQLNEAAPCSVYLVYDNRNIDLTKAREQFEEIDITGKAEVELKPDKAHIIIRGVMDGHVLQRKIEVVENVKPCFSSQELSINQNNQAIFKRIAGVVQMDRGEDEGFAMYNLLARKHLNIDFGKTDEELFQHTLDQIHRRIDCSDFLLSGLLRYMKTYPLDSELYDQAKKVILDYRYWMDQKGSDGMCFWSENHALMFYGCAMIAGSIFPDKSFVRAERTGRELYEAGRASVVQWLADIEAEGFEEFLSGGYMAVTFAALLNIVDFGDNELSERAARLTDRLLQEISLHTFKGSVIAPQGRVYRDVVYPFVQSVQAIINMIDPAAPYCLSEWLIFMATSKYKIPEGLADLIQTPADKEYTSGNALIKLRKTKDYIMTSVQSPREDQNKHLWNNISLDEEADPTTYAYVKSLNERFHGTTRFEPGVYGYQQHMWYAALDMETVVFANHPGGTYDGSSMRPGYWYGNGIMPAVKQEGSVIGSIYVIPESYPIHFTHLLWKEITFDKVVKVDRWLFGEKNGSYIGVWCSEDMVKVDDEMFNAEYRVYSNKAAYICHCSCEEECTTFENFITNCLEMKPCFDKTTLKLRACQNFFLQFEKHENLTQFI